MLARPVVATLAALLALPAAAQQPAAPPAAGPEPCEPVVPCEIPDEPAGAPAAGPADFAAEARLLFEVVSCRGAPLPSLDAKAVAAFCERERRDLAAFRDGPMKATAETLARLRPAGLPTTVLAPLGGGDLLSALLAFPDLKNVTTVSPEPAGDPRRLGAARTPAELRRELEAIRAASAALLRANGASGARPGARAEAPPVQLAALVTALALTGHEPVGLRYVRVERDGSLHALSRAELAAAGPVGFASCELTFVRRGEDPRTRARTYRHLAADLSDAALARSPGLLAHLGSKGELAVTLRGGPPLLGRADHARLRELLLRQAAFVLSDATGPAPREARAAGLVQETHGAYQGTAGADRARDAELVALFAAQPARPLAVRYGHLDRAGHPYLVVSRRGAPR